MQSIWKADLHFYKTQHGACNKKKFYYSKYRFFRGEIIFKIIIINTKLS